MVSRKRQTVTDSTDSGQRARAEGESAAEWVSVDRLKTWAKNPRKNDAAVAKVVASIQRFGFGAPLVVRRWEALTGGRASR